MRKSSRSELDEALSAPNKGAARSSGTLAVTGSSASADSFTSSAASACPPASPAFVSSPGSFAVSSSDCAASTKPSSVSDSSSSDSSSSGSSASASSSSGSSNVSSSCADSSTGVVDSSCPSARAATLIPPQNENSIVRTSKRLIHLFKVYSPFYNFSAFRLGLRPSLQSENRGRSIYPCK